MNKKAKKLGPLRSIEVCVPYFPNAAVSNTVRANEIGSPPFLQHPKVSSSNIPMSPTSDVIPAPKTPPGLNSLVSSSQIPMSPIA